MNFNEEEIEEILNDLANLKVKKKELLPFKKQLLLVSSSIGFELSFLIDDLLKLLPKFVKIILAILVIIMLVFLVVFEIMQFFK